MKIVHTLGWYFPGPSGGTEIYVDGLVHALMEYGIDSTIAAPRDGMKEETYDHKGIAVYRYPVFRKQVIRQIRGEIPHGGFENFIGWLKDQHAAIYHQHSWTMGCGLHHLQAAKNLGMTTVLTTHVASLVCLRETMMLYGCKACDGRIDTIRCSSCWGAGRGIPVGLAKVLAYLPVSFSKTAKTWLPPSSLTTALARRFLVYDQANRFRRMVELADRIVTVSQWLYDALLTNGVPKDKLILCRHGVLNSFYHTNVNRLSSSMGRRKKPMRIGFLGRWEKIKGLHILVEAICRLPLVTPVELVIHASANDPQQIAYRARVLTRAKKDVRIRAEEQLPHEKVASAIAGFDLLAVPSQCLETGPLVILEAQAIGTPILGSSLGGISELVEHGVNGLLFPATDVYAWSKAIKELAENPDYLEKLREHKKPIRTMNEVAKEMAAVYRDILPH